MTKPRVLHGFHDGVHVLRFIGEIRYMLAPAVDRFLDELFGAEPPERFAVDLTDAELIDSTNLGLIARIANRMEASDRPRVTIISDQEDINEILDSMGFAEVFDIVDDAPSAHLNGEEVGDPETDEQRLRRTVLTAHRALMALNEHNRDQFRDVVAALEHNGEEDGKPH